MERHDARKSPRKLLGAAGAIALAVTVVSCSPQSTTTKEQRQSTRSGEQERLNTVAGQPLTITPTQLLAATGGLTPVAFAQPTHGQISYGSDAGLRRC